MKTIKMIVELTYDDNIMHGDDDDAIRWFENEILMAQNANDLILHSNEVGDEIGVIRVIELCA